MVFMIIASTMGGAFLKFTEVMNDPNPLPTPKANNELVAQPQENSTTSGER